MRPPAAALLWPGPRVAAPALIWAGLVVTATTARACVGGCPSPLLGCVRAVGAAAPAADAALASNKSVVRCLALTYGRAPPRGDVRRFAVGPPPARHIAHTKLVCWSAPPPHTHDPSGANSCCGHRPHFGCVDATSSACLPTTRAHGRRWCSVLAPPHTQASGAHCGQAHDRNAHCNTTCVMSLQAHGAQSVCHMASRRPGMGRGAIVELGNRRAGVGRTDVPMQEPSSQ